MTIGSGMNEFEYNELRSCVWREIVRANSNNHSVESTLSYADSILKEFDLRFRDKLLLDK